MTGWMIFYFFPLILFFCFFFIFFRIHFTHVLLIVLFIFFLFFYLCLYEKRITHYFWQKEKKNNYTYLWFYEYNLRQKSRKNTGKKGKKNNVKKDTFVIRKNIKIWTHVSLRRKINTLNIKKKRESIGWWNLWVPNYFYFHA